MYEYEKGRSFLLRPLTMTDAAKKRNETAPTLSNSLARAVTLKYPTEREDKKPPPRAAFAPTIQYPPLSFGYSR